MSSVSFEKQRPDSVQDSVYDPARLVATEEGRVVYASPAFAQLLHATPTMIKGARVLDLMVFPAFHGAATRSDPQTFGLHTGVCGDIPEGRHSVVMPDHGPPMITFSCEWMQVGAGPRFLVITRVEDDEQVDVQSRQDSVLQIQPKREDPIPQVVDFGDRAFDIQVDDYSQNDDVFTPSVDEALMYLNTVATDEQDRAGLRHTDAFKGLVVGDSVKPSRDLLAVQQTPSVRVAFRKVLERGTRSEAQVFLDLSDDVMIRVDLNGVIQAVNQAGSTCFGLHPHAGYESQTLFDLVFPEDQPSVRALFMGFSHDPSLSGRVAILARMVDHAGQGRVFDMRLRRQGERVFVLAHDLTETRAREQKLAQHAQQLAEAESIAHLGYWRWAVGSDSLILSDEMYRIFGLNPANGAPRTEQIAAMIPLRDRGRVVQGIERAMFHQGPFEIDFSIKNVSGAMRYIRCEGRCDADETGDIFALFGMMQDVTDRKIAEHDLMQAKNAAERAYDSKSKFLANMSHELRTPLNAIIGFSEMMQRQLLGPLGNDRYLDYIDGIRASGEHLLDLISDILDMSKIEAGKYTLDPEDVNIGKLVRLAINMVEGRAREAQIILKTDIENENLHACADRRGVLQMMLNVLSNAIKFTRGGGKITVSIAEDDTYVKFSVIDTGIGIPAHLIPVITKPFEQVANHYTRSHDGSGLGLAITKELVDLHGGTLTITSELGVGTTVSFTILKKRP